MPSPDPVLDHEVVVIGAGPVGLLLACLLAQEGVDVVVCEQRDGEDARSRAIGIHPPGLEVLERAGVGAAARAEALALTGGDVLSRGKVLASLAFSTERPVLVLPQRRTHALLRQRLDTMAPTVLQAGRAVRGVRDEGDFVRLRIDAGGRRRELTAAFAVLADGVHSGLRTELGVGWRRRTGRARYAMADVPDPQAGTRALLHCGPAGLVESFPLPGGARRWVVRSADGEDLATGTGFRDAIRRRTGEDPEIGSDIAPVVFVAAQHLVGAAARGRIALVGDAAHEISPIGGQGMNLGWVDAGRLATTLRDALARRDADLGDYARVTVRAARAAQRRSAFYMAMGTPAGGLPLHLRETVIRALGSRPLQSWAAGLVTMRGL